MSDGSEDLAPEYTAYDPLTPAPAERRTLTMRDNFSLWFSLGIGLLVLQAGAGLSPGLGLVPALVAIVIGSVLGAVLLALAGVAGSDGGLATISALRPALGIYGAALPALLNVLQLLGWGVFEIVAMRDAADALSRQAFHFSMPALWTLLFGAAGTLIAIMGPLSFVRRVLRLGGVWLVLAGAGWLTFVLLSRSDLGALVAHKGDGSLAFGGGVDLVIAMPLSWLPLIADYSRFGTSAKSVFRGTALGYLVANIWFYALGAAFALTDTGPDGLLLSALAAVGGGLALLVILVDETDNVFANIFSAATSAATQIRLPVPMLVVGAGVLCTLLALVLPTGQYLPFLYMIGSVFAPLYGVMLTDHFVLRRRQVVTADIDRLDGAYGYDIGVNVTAMAAWLFGVIVYWMITEFAPAMGATLPSLVVAGGTFWGLKKLGM